MFPECSLITQESLNGVSVIRAFGAGARFAGENRAKINYHNRAWWIIHAGINRWLGIRLELVGTLVVLSTALLAVSGAPGIDDAGYIGN